jgi:hypothetical protein
MDAFGHYRRFVAKLAVCARPTTVDWGGGPHGRREDQRQHHE